MNFGYTDEGIACYMIKPHSGALECKSKMLAELYSECDFKGEKHLICEKDPEIGAKWKVKSIKVAPGYALKLYPKSQYRGVA